MEKLHVEVEESTAQIRKIQIHILKVSVIYASADDLSSTLLHFAQLKKF